MDVNLIIHELYVILNACPAMFCGGTKWSLSRYIGMEIQVSYPIVY